MLISNVANRISLKLIQEEMHTVLEKVGDSLYSSALDHINNSKISTDPKREISNATNSLNDAHKIYIKNAKRGKRLKDRLLNDDKRIDYYYKAAICTFFMAICYEYLNDRPLRINL